MFKIPKHLKSPPLFRQGVHKNFPAPNLPPLLNPRTPLRMINPKNQLGMAKKILNNPALNPLSLLRRKKKRK